jgi:CRP/FNR family transcriptional regulator, cyclic AMP receptor protein
MELRRKLELLQQTAYFASLPADQLRELATGLRERSYRAEAVIFWKGEQCKGLYIVLSGRVRTVTRSAEGRKQILKVFGPGRTFADIPVFDNGPLPAEAVAVTDTTIGLIPRAALLELLKRNPDVSLDVIRLFASRLRAYKQLVEDLSLRGVVARVARLLLDRSRGAHTLTEEAASLSPRLTQDEIAAMVGSVREVVQRALKTLEHDGAIQMARGRVKIVDVQELEVWSESSTRTAAEVG